MNMSSFTAVFLLLRFLFRSLYYHFFEQISHLDLLLSVISFVLSLEAATEVFFIIGVLSNYVIYRKTLMLGSLFNEVVGLQACNYI